MQLTGTASYQLAKDELWNAIKASGGWEDDVVADIKVANNDLHGQYTVKGGDSLSKIARYIYGDASAFQRSSTPTATSSRRPTSFTRAKS